MSGRLPARDRHQIYIALGLGDRFTAVGLLLRLAVSRRIALPADWVADARLWLEAYRGAPEEKYLRELLRLVTVKRASAQEAST